MARIELTDTMMDMIVKMVDGNPGATMALMEVIEKHEAIDPQAFMGGIGAVMTLDTWGIYGTDIYVLFNDQCNRDVRQFLMLLRATQLGFFSQSRLQQIAGDQTRSNVLTEDELEDLDKQVCDRLEDFQRKAA